MCEVDGYLLDQGRFREWTENEMSFGGFERRQLSGMDASLAVYSGVTRHTVSRGFYGALQNLKVRKVKAI